MTELAVAAVDVAPALEQLHDRLTLKRGDGMHSGAARRCVIEAACASAVLPATAPATVELQHGAGPSCRPARHHGAVDEIQQAGLHAGIDTRGHADGHPQRSFPSNKVTLTAISLSASPNRAASSRAITSSGSMLGPSQNLQGWRTAGVGVAARGFHSAVGETCYTCSTTTRVGAARARRSAADLRDSPNIYAAADGEAKAEFFTTLVTVDGGTMPTLLDDDGSAVVIHENPDDHVTQPIGGAGGRVGCGVVK